MYNSESTVTFTYVALNQLRRKEYKESDDDDDED